MSAAAAHQMTVAPGFSRLVTVAWAANREDWPDSRAREVCRDLEAGHIVFLPRSPIEIPPADLEILLGRKQSSST